MSVSLGILLAEADRAGVAAEIARNFAPSPAEVQLFLMDEGVRAANDPRLAALLDDGAEIALCAMDAEARGVAPVDGGPRFGSQYDHAVMMRSARRVIAMTGARIDDHRPARESGRTVAVRLTLPAAHPKTAQALRAAVGYAAGNLRVAVLVEPPARAVLVGEELPPAVLRALATLRGLDMPLVGVAPWARPPQLAWDIEVTW